MNYWVRGASKWLPMVVTILILLWALSYLVDRKTFQNVTSVEDRIDSVNATIEEDVVIEPTTAG